MAVQDHIRISGEGVHLNGQLVHNLGLFTVAHRDGVDCAQFELFNCDIRWEDQPRHLTIVEGTAPTAGVEEVIDEAPAEEVVRDVEFAFPSLEDASTWPSLDR